MALLPLSNIDEYHDNQSEAAQKISSLENESLIKENRHNEESTHYDATNFLT